MQVTFGDDGSGFSKPLPLFFPVAGNIAGDAPPLMLRLFLSLRLCDFESEIGGGSRAAPALAGLRIDLDEIFMEDGDVKQTKRWVDLAAVVVVVYRNPLTAIVIVAFFRWVAVAEQREG